MQQIFAGQAGL